MKRMPDTSCPNCHHRFNAASAIDIEADENKGPKPGDFGICIQCGSVLVYDDNLSARLATDEEMKELPEDTPRVQAAIRLMWDLKHRKGSRSWRELSTIHPGIKWDEPMEIVFLTGGKDGKPCREVYFGCRVCIAINGLSGKNMAGVPRSRAEFDEHFRKEHLSQ